MFIGNEDRLREFAATLARLTNTPILTPAPYRNVRKNRRGDKAGCRIDLLVQTPKTAYVVEVKRRNKIGPEVEDEVRERMRRLPLRAGMSKRPVLVCDGHLDPVVEGGGGSSPPSLQAGGYWGFEMADYFLRSSRPL